MTAGPLPPDALTLAYNPLQQVVCAVLERDGMYLLTLPDDALDGSGAWSLPGVALPPNGDPVDALKTGIRAALGVAITVAGRIDSYRANDTVHHVYHAYPCSTAFVLTSNAILYHAWLTREEIAVWHIADRLHSGFELRAITAASRGANPAR